MRVDYTKDKRIRKIVEDLFESEIMRSLVTLALFEKTDLLTKRAQSMASMGLKKMVEETHWGKEATCPHCGSELVWVDCWNCEEGYSYHDCGEDCCCCLDPRPNVVCDICDGEGGWYVCLSADSCNKTERVTK